MWIGPGVGLPLAFRGGGFDTDYLSILEAASTLNYTLPSDEQQVLQNQLVLSLKKCGAWDKLDLFYVFATDGDSDFATINWKNPNSFKITKVNTPTFTTDVGFQNNSGSHTTYLDTGWNASTDADNYSRNSATIGFYGDILENHNLFSDNPANYMGARDSNFAFIQNAVGPAVDYAYINSDGVQAGPDPYQTSSVGLIQHTRLNSTDIETYLNGSRTGTASQSSTGVANLDHYILTSNTNGSPDTFYSSGSVSVAYYGSDLSSEASDIYAAIYNDYISNL